MPPSRLLTSQGADYTVTLTPLPQRVVAIPAVGTVPAIQIQRLGDDLWLSWSGNVTGWSVESTPTLDAATSWTHGVPTPRLIDGRWTVRIPPGPGPSFFRLTR